MSSTNKTTNYELPQFISTDKPTWLNDINGAFSTIDTGMKANQTAAANAQAKADAAATNASVTALAGRVTGLESDVEALQTDLVKLRVYDGAFVTGTLTGNSRHSVTVSLPANATSVLAVLPYGFDPSSNWNTVLYFDGAGTDGVVSFHINGAANQYYSIKYKVFYTVA